jgi:regulator of ribonuclease activity A
VEYITADLVDLHEATLRSCEAQFRNFSARTRFHGPIRTLKAFEDNALLKQLFSSPGNGAVLVVDSAGSLRTSMLGDFIAGLGEQNGWAGIVIWGAVRDTVALAGLKTLGVKALGSNPFRSGKTGSGQIDVPVTFGGVTFRAGEWLYSDEDGMVVSERALPLPEASSPATAARQHS